MNKKSASKHSYKLQLGARLLNIANMTSNEYRNTTQHQLVSYYTGQQQLAPVRMETTSDDALVTRQRISRWNSSVAMATGQQLVTVTTCTFNNKQQQPFYGPLCGTIWVSRYQKKHSPIHHPDHHPVFITFFHLPRSIASSLFKLRARQSFCTTSFHVLFGLPLGLEPSTSYSIHFFTQPVSSVHSTVSKSTDPPGPQQCMPTGA